MVLRRCPNCGSLDASYLQKISRNTYADYQRCDRCGGVFCVSKTDESAVPRMVGTLIRSPQR